MFSLKRAARAAITAAIAALVGLGLLSAPAQADPPPEDYRELVGLCSDTTYDVMQALAPDCGSTVLRGES